jgi:hypothetical protein
MEGDMNRDIWSIFGSCLIIATAFLSSGCNGSGSIASLFSGGADAVYSFFGGDSSGGGSDLLLDGPAALLTGSESDGVVDELGETIGSLIDGIDESSGFGDSGGSEGVVAAAAVLHNPEPASMALFGSGLVGMGFLRRRSRSAQPRS